MTHDQTPKLEIHYDPNGSWAALYVDGNLRQVGDAHVAEEIAFDLLGVTVVRDNAFLMGGATREDVAKTSQEVHEFRARREELYAQAEQLRQRAAELRAEAERIERAGSDR